MLEAAVAQLRYAVSMVFGLPFSPPSLDRLVDAVRATQHEFGQIGADGAAFLGGPPLDEETRQAVQQRRFRTQAVRAARHTPYYAALFAQRDLDPHHLRFADIARVPLTRKQAVRDDPDAFVCRTASPCFRATTTGTTGTPTSIAFSARELQTFIALAAIGYLTHPQSGIGPADSVLLSTSARGSIATSCVTGACVRVGAEVSLGGLIAPAATLARLREPRRLPGKKGRVSVLSTYPSYLGELTTHGLRLGYRPTDFGLERIWVGGELVSAGLKRRCQELFGPVAFDEGYGMTEIWPFGGSRCPDGHLHYEVSQGLLEVERLEGDGRAAPGEVGTVVATPFPPYRETTLLLRYDTEDVVRVPAEPPTCSLHNLPATSNLLGKRRLAVRHAQGWTFPRDVLEALEGLDEVALPARFGFWAAGGGGVAVEVVAPNIPSTRRRIGEGLEARGVRLHELDLVDGPDQLRQPFPLRGDLREVLFSGRAGDDDGVLNGRKETTLAAAAVVTTAAPTGC